MGAVRTPLARRRAFSVERDTFAMRRTKLKSRTIGKPPRNPTFSIVSAVYNVEKHLSDYFTSIVLQPELHGQIQVIVVNDGSTDSSLDILNTAAPLYTQGGAAVMSELNDGNNVSHRPGVPAVCR